MVSETERLILESLDTILFILDEQDEGITHTMRDKIQEHLNPTKKEHDYERHFTP